MFFWDFNSALIEVLKWIYRRKTQAQELDLLRMAENPPQAGHITIRAFSDNHAERKDHTKIQNFERLSQIYLQLEIFAVKNLQKQVLNDFSGMKKLKNAQEAICGPKIKNPSLGSRRTDFNRHFLIFT